jgi:hypothetical protein
MLLAFFVQHLAHPLAWLEGLYLHWTPVPQASVALGSAFGLSRPKSELLLENALLRQQLVILQRQVKKPPYRPFSSSLLIIPVKPFWTAQCVTRIEWTSSIRSIVTSLLGTRIGPFYNKVGRSGFGRSG